jgi:mono/diheme cytochrome c family protein
VRRVVAAAAAAIALLAAGCGGSGHHASAVAGNSAGAKVFSSASCGACHTLSAAKSTGAIGPNLDQLKPSEDAVVRQVTGGGNGMPAFKGRLTSRQIGDLAKFVADSAKGSKLVAQGFGSIAAGFKPSKQTVASCKTWRCYEQAFGNLAYYQGAKVALTRFAAAIDTIPAVHDDCHLIAHAIGAGAYVRYRDPGKAFVAAGTLATTCNSGFYHGVLQRALHGVQQGQVLAVAKRLCSGKAVNTTFFVLTQCIHGLGHGLMIYSGYDLPKALATCDSLPERFQQATCTGGVFMENNFTSLGIPSPWLKANDPLYPCDWVKPKDKTLCYEGVTGHLLDVTHYDWRKTAAWCWKSDKGWIATCFQSMGRDASGWTLQNPSKIFEICKLAGAKEIECVYGAARTIVADDAGARRASPFCSQAPASMQGYCFRGLGSVLGGFHPQQAARRAACRAAVPQRYWTDCFQGARA